MDQSQETNVASTDSSSPGDSGYRGIRNIQIYARLAIPVAALFAVVYFCTNWITTRRTGNYQLFFDCELAIPLVPDTATNSRSHPLGPLLPFSHP
jgi:hypothetical protein